MKLIYCQLNDFDPNHSCFPLDFYCCFSDGFNVFPIFFPLMGKIVYKSETTNISESDKKCCEILGVKKLPGNVIVWIDKGMELH